MGIMVEPPSGDIEEALRDSAHRPFPDEGEGHGRPSGRGVDQVAEKPLLGQPGDLFQCARLGEQVRCAGDDLELPGAAQPLVSLAVERQHGLVVAADDQERGAVTRGRLSPARSGRPPRETTAPTASPGRAAATRAAPAPVLAPK